MTARILPLWCSLALTFTAGAALPRVEELTCEHEQNPLGLGAATPRLSWKIQSGRDGEVQTAYQIRAARSESALASGRNVVWDSGKLPSDQSVLVPWAGPALKSRDRIFWQVRIWGAAGVPSPWSQTASFELGLLHPDNEWKAKWITADLPRYDVMAPTLADASWINDGSAATQAAAIRFAFELPANAVVRRAFVDAAGDGLLTIYLNDRANRQGSSSRTAPLHADVTGQCAPGKNLIAIGSAAVRGAVRRDGNAAGRNAIAARVLIELQDGRKLAFNTDAHWKAAAAPSGNWFETAFDDSGWRVATVLGRYAEQPSRYCDNTIGPGRYLRKNFTTSRAISSARLYATALGVYEASINGQPLGDARLDPGWTDYAKRVMVQTFDVTAALRRGDNTLGVVLSDGWYAGRVGWMGVAQYGPRPSFAGQLEITYNDGSRDTIVTDESWKAGDGEIVGSDMQWGEIVDARKTSGWNQPSFDDSKWSPVVVEEHRLALDPQRGPRVRARMELTPKKITRRGDAWLVDLGQNFVGHVRLSARGPAGTTITVRHAEMLDAAATNSSLYTENLRPALSLDTFILKGGARETFEPQFTFHGFRYVEVAGYPGELTAGDIRGVVVGSDTPETGTWESSDANLNRLYENIVWSQRGNFLSVPTDCPQRDERMGWMGDAQVFAPTAARNADVAGFFTKWLLDVNDAQGPRGEFPTVAPRANQNNSWPVWGDAGVIIPWAMYLAYGDKAFLADNYEHMARWVDYCRQTSANLILNGGVGDHLAPRPTPTSIVDTAYFANSVRIVSLSAVILGKGEEAMRYEKLFQDIKAAFNTNFVGADGSITAPGGFGFRGRGAAAASTNSARIGNTQTAFLLALRFDLLPENLKAEAARRLAESVETNGHLTTGFVGVGQICPGLTRIGRSDLAWQLVFNDTYPSWLFSVKNGATTIWERWDGWTPERGFQDPAMNSFNHYSFGSIGEWLFSGAAGINSDPISPGYKHFFLRPQFTPRLSFVKATQETQYGLILSHWHVEKDQMVYDIHVPPNTTAQVTLPVASRDVRMDGKPLGLTSPAGTYVVPVSSGNHQFIFPRELISAAAR